MKFKQVNEQSLAPILALATPNIPILGHRLPFVSPKLLIAGVQEEQEALRDGWQLWRY